MRSPVAYTTTTDGVRIAYSICGRGLPIISMPPIPVRHLELEWELPEDRRWLERLAVRHSVVQYDPRGLGLSDRAATPAYSLDTLIRDVEAVVEQLESERVALFAAVSAGPIAIAYAARHPTRVSHLILWCTSARVGEGIGPLKALLGLVEQDWELATETIAHVLRGWSAGESARGLARMLRACASPAVVRELAAVLPAIDVTELLPCVTSPTLVLHRRGVTWLPVERATDLASRIPGARLALFEGTSMAPWAGDMEAAARAVEQFLGTSEADAPVGTEMNVFRQEGEYWTLAFAGRLCRLRDAKGLHHILYLLRRAAQQLPAGELLAALDTPGGAPASSLGDAGPMLDAQAKSAYRRRLEDLRSELAEAERFDDAGRAAAARTEMALIAQQLSAAVGLGGRDRRAGSASERARLTVTKRIKDAVERVRRSHPELGEHLALNLRTGLLCAYVPDPPVRWSF